MTTLNWILLMGGVWMVIWGFLVKIDAKTPAQFFIASLFGKTLPIVLGVAQLHLALSPWLYGTT